MGCAPPSGDSDWGEWRNYVLKELERHDNNIETLREKIETMKVEIGQLQTKYSIIAVAINIFALVAYYIITHL